MELPSFEWDENIFDAPGISTGGDLDALALTKARVIFVSNLLEDVLLKYQGNSQVPPTKVFGSVDATGQVVDKNGYPPRLLANDDELSVANIQWTRTLLRPSPSGAMAMKPLTFVAPLDGESVGPDTAAVADGEPPEFDDDITYIIEGTP